ncbi:hypothetical protein TSAR_006744 [Trichomalopsis sarcophagae]|uniref:Uncharacterized protein n=1 Tax=Trichomalopsis sarcophagae TaxID=543379 RepID=A0A232F5H0_9HYME|nr:hypothetical protein TSAR_006744 [Trichomalopsis sarcophagae]
MKRMTIEWKLVMIFMQFKISNIKRNIKRTAVDVSGSTRDNDDGVDDCARHSSKLCFDVPDKSFHLAQIQELLDIVQNLPMIKEYQRAIVKINIAQTILADLTQTDPRPQNGVAANEKDKDCKDGKDEDDEYTADEIALSRRLKVAKYRARQANGQIVKLPPTAEAVPEDKRVKETCQASRRKGLYSTYKMCRIHPLVYCSAMSELLIERQMNQSKSAGEFASQPSKTAEIKATTRTDRKRVWQGNGDKKSLNDPAAQVMDSSGSGCE